MEPIRIQKYFSEIGVASRRECEEWLRNGVVTVNGTKAELGVKVVPGEDKIAVNGKLVLNTRPPKVYWLLNKPDKTMVTQHDELGRPTVFQLPSLRSNRFKVNAVGRLDYRTEGLLLLTNDGELANVLCHPSFKVPRQYNVRVERRLSDDEEKTISKGVALSDGVSKPAELRYIHSVKMGAKRYFWYQITVYEGRNRLVRRLFEHFSVEVSRLIRFGFGDIQLPMDLKPGMYRQLTPEELRGLKRRRRTGVGPNETRKSTGWDA